MIPIHQNNLPNRIVFISDLKVSRLENIFPLYKDARDICFNSINAVSEVFADLTQESQLIELMSNPLHYKIISKFMHTILNQRRHLLYL